MRPDFFCTWTDEKKIWSAIFAPQSIKKLYLLKQIDDIVEEERRDDQMLAFCDHPEEGKEIEEEKKKIKKHRTTRRKSGKYGVS